MLMKNLHASDCADDTRFHDLIVLAARLCATPVAWLCFVDAERLLIEAATGITPAGMPLPDAFREYAIRQREVFEHFNLALVSGFRGHPRVAGQPHLRFLAGAPIFAPDGETVGVLCVSDTVPRELSGEQRDTLRILARLAAPRRELQARPHADARIDSAVQEFIRFSACHA